MIGDPDGLGRQLERRYGLTDVALTPLDTLVNDVVDVRSAQGRFALKLYHAGRTEPAVRSETELVDRLVARGAPVAAVVRGAGGLVELLTDHGRPRIAVLSHWAAGRKPVPSRPTYVALGRAAALIHAAATGLPPGPDRDRYDAATLIDDQLRRMDPYLTSVGVRGQLHGLADRLRVRLDDPDLDWGVCHMDLTLDNVHLTDDGVLTVFDFDSAGESWRAIEPAGVLRFSRRYFADWLEGYRSIREFSAADEAAVPALALVSELRGVVWQLGAADSSRGTPLIKSTDLPSIVGNWLAWEQVAVR